MKKLLMCTFCLFLLGFSWILVWGMSNLRIEAEAQSNYINIAKLNIYHREYITAVAPLQRAIAINHSRKSEAVELLLETYINLGYIQEYYRLLRSVLHNPLVEEGVLMRAAQREFSNRNYADGLAILREGLTVTERSSNEMKALFEQYRYTWFFLNDVVYDYLSVFYNGWLQAKRDGYWGLLDTRGRIIIPHMYEKISTAEAYLLVKKDGEIFFINDENQRRLLVIEPGVSDFANIMQSITAFEINGRWRITAIDGDQDSRNIDLGQIFLNFGTFEYDFVGAFSNDRIAVGRNGQYGLLDINANFILEMIYDGIITDDLGRSFAQNAVFVRLDNHVYMVYDGIRRNITFEDAHPFSDNGLAAVMNNGLWGFVNTEGRLIIDYSFNNARSFHSCQISSHNGLAPVQHGVFWGYIDEALTGGRPVVEGPFLEARPFYNGVAPVRIQDGWRLIKLYNAERGRMINVN